MTDATLPDTLVPLGLEGSLWDRFFTVAPLVVVGTREADGRYDLAPKHLAMPMGWGPHFGFVCTPRHRTYHNAQREGAFTVSYPRPSQVVLASLAASPRCDEGTKPITEALPTFPAQVVDGPFVEGGYLFLGCTFDRVVDGFGVNSLVVGRVVEAYVHEEALRVSGRDDQEVVRAVPLLAYLAPGRFSQIQEAHAFPFPEGFRR